MSRYYHKTIENDITKTAKNKMNNTKQKTRRLCRQAFRFGGGQEIRNTPEAFHLVPRSSKKSGFKPFLHFHISRVFTAFHQNKGHIKDTERSSSTAAVTRQRLFYINQVFKKSINTDTRRYYSYESSLQNNVLFISVSIFKLLS